MTDIKLEDITEALEDKNLIVNINQITSPNRAISVQVVGVKEKDKIKVISKVNAVLYERVGFGTIEPNYDSEKETLQLLYDMSGRRFLSREESRSTGGCGSSFAYRGKID